MMGSGTADVVCDGWCLHQLRKLTLNLPAHCVGSVHTSEDATNLELQRSDDLLHAAIYAGLASFLVALISYNFVDIDLWHQMALIRESLSAGYLLKADPYAYTPTICPWIDHEWGAGAIAYFATLWFGGRAILILKFLLALGTGFLCVRCSRAKGTDFRLLGLCAPLAIFLAYLGIFTAIRAQAYSFFFTALLLLFLELDRKGSRAWILVWLVIFPLWVNLHGGFVVAIGLMGLFLVEELLRGNAVRRLLLVLVATCLEVFINPYGAAYFAYLRRAVTMARPYAPEWRPIWDLGPAWTIAFSVAVVVALYAAVSVGFRRGVGILPLLATAVEAALHRKLLPFFAIAWLCCVPFFLQQTDAGKWFVRFTQRRTLFMRMAWSVFACVCLIAAVRQKPWSLSVPQRIYPVGSVEYLARQKFKGNVMTPFRLGAYVSWKLFPAVKVSLDSRYEETYPNRIMQSIFRFYEAAPDWPSTLDAFPTDVVLIPRDAPISRAMPLSGWNKVYLDQQFELYARPGRALPLEDRSSASFTGVLP